MLRTRTNAIARRAYGMLPSGLAKRLKSFLAKRAYTVRTSGLRPDEAMVSSVRLQPRPFSIVIPSYNDLPLLTKCLESIESTCAGLDYEVIVVDDYCEPHNSELLRTLEHDRVRVIFKERRQGFAVSVNVGMASAQHDIVLLNSDIVALPGWIEALQYSAYEVDERIGLVSPKLIYPNGRIQYGGTYYARILAPQWFGHLYVGSPAMRPVANVAGYNRSISGACVYLRKEAYEKLGPLDETYWLGFEDVDYGLTAWTRGIRCYYQPAATLIHHESASRGYSQGKRELGSMRHFWGKWHKAFLHRTLPTSESVDFVLSRASDALWHDYVDDQASRLRDLGYEVAVHAVAEGTPAHAADETVVSSLRDRSSLKVCCDWGAATTVWLSSLEHGKPVYLLPTVESGAFPGDTNRQSAIVAGYRPEFDYIAPNRWTADQLRAEAAWETAARVVPALSPVVSAVPVADATPPNTDGRPATVPRVVSVGLAAAQRADLDQIVHAHGGETTHVGEDLDRAQLETIAGLGPRAIVTSAEWPNSLAPLALMSTGGVLVGRANEKTRYEVLDGYNALLIDPSDTSRLGQTLADLLSDEQMWSELRGNGLASAQKAYAACTPALVAALGSIAVTPV